MTDERLGNLIEQLNSGIHKDVFTIEPLSPTVDKGWVKVFNSNPDEDSVALSDTDVLYFIKGKDGMYVGAVLQMEENYLHWYVLPEYRKKGYVSTALSKSIIPHLFLEKDVVRAFIDIDSFDDNAIFKNSESVALRVGLKKISRKEYSLFRKDFNRQKSQ